MNQVGKWSQFYIDDFDGFVCRARLISDDHSETEITFQSKLTRLYCNIPYRGGAFTDADPDISLRKQERLPWRCPANATIWQHRGASATECLGNYAVNRSAAGSGEAKSGTVTGNFRKVSAFRKPSRSALVMDGRSDGDGAGITAWPGTYLEFTYYLSSEKFTDGQRYGSVGYQHSDQTNTMFVDGHVAATRHLAEGRQFPDIAYQGGNDFYE